MFGKKRILRKDLPAIDIRQKAVKGFFGKVRWVPTSKKEQRAAKKMLMEKFPDRYFVDDLNEWNSIRGIDADLAWIDEIENYCALFED